MSTACGMVAFTLRALAQQKAPAEKVLLGLFVAFFTAQALRNRGGQVFLADAVIFTETTVPASTATVLQPADPLRTTFSSPDGVDWGELQTQSDPARLEVV